MSTLLVKIKRPYLSLTLKIWFIFLLVFIPTYVVMFYFHHLFIVRREAESLTADLTHYVDRIIETIDAENFKAIYENEAAKNKNCPPKRGTAFDDPSNGYFPKENLFFLEHMNWMKNLTAFEPERSVYTYVIGPEKDYVITISSSWYFTNPNESFKFCQLYKAPNMYKGLSQRVDIWKPYHDEYGYWISTYMPIKDKDGHIVGAVGVDIPAQQIIDAENELLRGAAYLLLGTIFVSLGIAYSLTATISRPLSDLTLLTSNVKDSASTIDFSTFNTKRTGWNDEIDILSNSVQGMMSRINKQAHELSQTHTEMQDLAHNVIRAQENERKYISRELHGEAGQLLVMLKTTLDDVLLDLPSERTPESSVKINSSSIRDRIVYAARKIEETLGVIRSISHQMRPTLLDVGDVNLALNDYCKEFSQHQKIEVLYEGFIIPNPPEDVAVSFYRFLQEALTNVSKHSSSATRVSVRAKMDMDWIEISVEDNGNRNQSTPSNLGIGLAGLKERFFLLGGMVESCSIPGGFLVVARAPLARP